MYSQSLFRNELIAMDGLSSFMRWLVVYTETTPISHADTDAPYWSIFEVHTGEKEIYIKLGGEQVSSSEDR